VLFRSDAADLLRQVSMQLEADPCPQAHRRYPAQAKPLEMLTALRECASLIARRGACEPTGDKTELD
jgi:hypothetical protein